MNEDQTRRLGEEIRRERAKLQRLREQGESLWTIIAQIQLIDRLAREINDLKMKRTG